MPVHGGLVEDLPDGAGRDPVARADQFTLDPAVPLQRVLRGQPQHQLADLSADRWPARPGTRVRPMPSDQLPVPAKEGRRGDKERRPLRTGQQPRQNANTTRSAGSRSGRRTWRRSAATWWRRDQEFDALAPPSRSSWVNIYSTCRSSTDANETLMGRSVAVASTVISHRVPGQTPEPGLRVRQGVSVRPAGSGRSQSGVIVVWSKCLRPCVDRCLSGSARATRVGGRRCPFAPVRLRISLR
jgi:hypothetical protein